MHPHLGPYLQPRHMPLPGIEPVTFGSWHDAPTKLSHTGKGLIILINKNSCYVLNVKNYLVSLQFSVSIWSQ